MAQDRPCPVHPEVVTNAADDMVKSLRPSLSRDLFSLGHTQLLRGRALSSTAIQTGYSDRSRRRNKHDETYIGSQLPVGFMSHSFPRLGVPRNQLATGSLLSPEPASSVVFERREPPFQPIYTHGAETDFSYRYSSVNHVDSVNHINLFNTARNRPLPFQQLGHDESCSSRRGRHHEHNTSISPGFSPSISERDPIQSGMATPVHPGTSSHYSNVSEPTPSTRSGSVSSFISPSSCPLHLKYSLNIRQQPLAARACGFGERDRRVIDPPPILQLKISNGKTGDPEQDPNALLAVHCTLAGVELTSEDVEAEPVHSDAASLRCLLGTTVASPYQAKDEYGAGGTFFVFPDLSCRTPGRYRLHFKLLRVDPTRMMPGTRHGAVSSIETDVFNVYTPKDFPGMQASSALLAALHAQGLNVGLKRGAEARVSKSKKRKGNVCGDSGDAGETRDEPRISSY